MVYRHVQCESCANDESEKTVYKSHTFIIFSLVLSSPVFSCTSNSAMLGENILRQDMRMRTNVKRNEQRRGEKITKNNDSVIIGYANKFISIIVFVQSRALDGSILDRLCTQCS